MSTYLKNVTIGPHVIWLYSIRKPTVFKQETTGCIRGRHACALACARSSLVPGEWKVMTPSVLQQVDALWTWSLHTVGGSALISSQNKTDRLHLNSVHLRFIGFHHIVRQLLVHTAVHHWGQVTYLSLVRGGLILQLGLLDFSCLEFCWESILYFCHAKKYSMTSRFSSSCEESDLTN